MSEPITLYRGGHTKTVHAPSQAVILEQSGWSRTPPTPAPPVEPSQPGPVDGEGESITLYRGQQTMVVTASSEARRLIAEGWMQGPLTGTAVPLTQTVTDDNADDEAANGVAVAGADDDDEADDEADEDEVIFDQDGGLVAGQLADEADDEAAPAKPAAPVKGKGKGS